MTPVGDREHDAVVRTPCLGRPYPPWSDCQPATGVPTQPDGGDHHVPHLDRALDRDHVVGHVGDPRRPYAACVLYHVDLEHVVPMVGHIGLDGRPVATALPGALYQVVRGPDGDAVVVGMPKDGHVSTDHGEARAAIAGFALMDRQVLHRSQTGQGPLAVHDRGGAVGKVATAPLPYKAEAVAVPHHVRPHVLPRDAPGVVLDVIPEPRPHPPAVHGQTVLHSTTGGKLPQDPSVPHHMGPQRGVDRPGEEVVVAVAGRGELDHLTLRPLADEGDHDVLVGTVGDEGVVGRPCHQQPHVGGGHRRLHILAPAIWKYYLGYGAPDTSYERPVDQVVVGAICDGEVGSGPDHIEGAFVDGHVEPRDPDELALAGQVRRVGTVDDHQRAPFRAGHGTGHQTLRHHSRTCRLDPECIKVPII